MRKVLFQVSLATSCHVGELLAVSSSASHFVDDLLLDSPVVRASPSLRLVLFRAPLGSCLCVTLLVLFLTNFFCARRGPSGLLVSYFFSSLSPSFSFVSPRNPSHPLLSLLATLLVLFLKMPFASSFGLLPLLLLLPLIHLLHRLFRLRVLPLLLPFGRMVFAIWRLPGRLRAMLLFLRSSRLPCGVPPRPSLPLSSGCTIC